MIKIDYRLKFLQLFTQKCIPSLDGLYKYSSNAYIPLFQESFQKVWRILSLVVRVIQDKRIETCVWNYLDLLYSFPHFLPLFALSPMATLSHVLFHSSAVPFLYAAFQLPRSALWDTLFPSLHPRTKFSFIPLNVAQPAMNLRPSAPCMGLGILMLMTIHCAW